MKNQEPVREKTQEQKRFIAASDAAKKILKRGDRIRVAKCPGGKRTITFDHFDGPWIVSKSGIDDYAPVCVDRINGQPVCWDTFVSEKN